MSAETTKKGIGPFKYILAIELVIFLGLLITGFVLLFKTLFGPDISTDPGSIWWGLGFIYGAVGVIPLILVPTVLTMVFKRRKVMFSSINSFKLSKIGPYAPGYKPSGVKKPRFCEYCGYEVLTGERECPECGGPVRTIDSSYI